MTLTTISQSLGRSLRPLALGVLALGCAQATEVPATQIVVAITSDLVAGSELTRVHVTLSKPGAADGGIADQRDIAIAPASGTPKQGQTRLPLSFPIKPGGNPQVQMEVAGYGVFGALNTERLVVTQRLIVSFQLRATVLVEVFLASTCADKQCNDPSKPVCYPTKVGLVQAGECGSAGGLSDAQSQVVSAGKLGDLPKLLDRDAAVATSSAGRQDAGTANGGTGGSAAGSGAGGTSGSLGVAGTGGSGGTGGTSGAGGAGGTTSSDPCTTDHGGCDPLVTCTAASSTVTCGACPSGYTGDGHKCTDIDECKLKLDDCKPNSTCENTPGSYNCPCNPGWYGDGHTLCEPNVLCNATGSNCAPEATGTDLSGQKFCICGTYYTGDGKTCTDKDECATNNGGCGDTTYALCTNNPGAPPTCTAKPVCATNNGGCGSATYTACTNNVGFPPTCTDINECASTNVCTADYPCQNLSPGYTCRGQFQDWPPAYSASAFSSNGDGTVTDSRSGLVWQASLPTT